MHYHDKISTVLVITMLLFLSNVSVSPYTMKSPSITKCFKLLGEQDQVEKKEGSFQNQAVCDQIQKTCQLIN